MPNITLICTQHEEKGFCNLKELLEIIKKINPDVIFEELPPYAIDDYYVKKSKSTLETRTIRAYLENNQIKHIPVDLDFDPLSLIEKNRRAHIRVEANSHEYRRLVDWNSQYVARYGFRYLNSDFCNNIHSETYGAIEKTLMKLNDDKLFGIFNQWNDIIEKREDEMISNIYQYSKYHDFARGLFFIGAAHRKSIIEKIQKQSESEEIELNWYYDNYENIL